MLTLAEPMSSGIYAVAHIGYLRLLVGDASQIKQLWPPILAQLESNSYPHARLQEIWNREGMKRHFTFHTHAELLHDRLLVGAELLKSRPPEQRAL